MTEGRNVIKIEGLNFVTLCEPIEVKLFCEGQDKITVDDNTAGCQDCEAPASELLIEAIEKKRDIYRLVTKSNVMCSCNVYDWPENASGGESILYSVPRK